MGRKREQLDGLLAEVDGTYEEFCRRAEISIRALWNLRRGHVQRPHRRTISALARALGVSRERVAAAIEESRGA